jgi:hypothetical protein
VRLTFETRCGTFAITCDTARAPHTLAAVARLLPMTARLQSPKIAGSHVYWQSPIVADVESAADVMSAPPGTFLYWPERQFLELIYAPLQAETAAVSILGHMEGDIVPLEQLGRMVRERHGHELTEGVLRLDGPAPRVEREPEGAAGLEDLHRARIDIWADCPAEINALMAGRGLMHPAGPLLIAESESRGLHEALWGLRQHLLAGEPADRVTFAAASACDKAAGRLGGFCHLGGPASTIRALAAALQQTELLAALEEGIMIAGGLSAWLDLQIPWNDINETVRRVRDASGKSPQHGQ